MSDATAITPDDAADALMYQQDARAPALDGYAHAYQAAISLRAYLDQYKSTATEPLESEQATRLVTVLEAYTEAMREHVATAYPAAVRRTLDRE